MLVLRCQTGDEAAFAELCQRYGPPLRYYVQKMLGRQAGEAEDLLQEVWLDVFRHVPRLVDPAAFPAWVYRIAHDRALRHLRKRWPAASSLVDEAVAEEEPEPEFTAEDARRVHAGLDELPPEQREVLLLRFLEEMSYEEIARVVGLPLGTVRSRIHYAKRALKGILERNHEREATGKSPAGTGRGPIGRRA
jgi:RNA polymerase sigma-70 factor (ECF subfamily)